MHRLKNNDTVRHPRRHLAAFCHDERGATAVIVAISLSALIACAALVFDLGASYVKAEKLQTALDAAVSAGGEALPCATSDSGKQSVETIVSRYLAANGFPSSDVSVDYSFEAWGTSGYDYAVRATATTTQTYGFARVLGLDSGSITRTSRIVATPIDSTFKAIAVYITQASFTAQAPNLSPDVPFTITVTKSGYVTSSTNMGIMRVVTETDRSNYATYEGITSPRHAEFFKTGYYGLRVIDGTPTKVGLTVGESRPIENATQIYSDLQSALSWRITQCGSVCSGSCTYDHHDNDCPRIALLPVVTTSGSYAKVTSFVAIWISGVSTSSSVTTITAYYLDDYRVTSDVQEVDTSIAITPYTVCNLTLTE